MIPVDVIVPIYWIDWNFFSNNLKTWYQELPIRKLYIGYNNPDDNLFEILKKYLKQYQNVELIDQRRYKTLGYCLGDLMKHVKMEKFVYLHSDVELTPYCFQIMEKFILNNDKIGILESERLLYNGQDYSYNKTFFRERAYSGFQLFRTSIIKDFIKTIDDDFIYRNEDLIFQNVCKNQGYEYKKTMAMHIHQITNTQWTFDKKDAHEMQFKGLIKYTFPDDITTYSCIISLIDYLKQYDFDFIAFLDNFVKKLNPIWKETIILEIIDKYIKRLR